MEYTLSNRSSLIFHFAASPNDRETLLPAMQQRTGMSAHPRVTQTSGTSDTIDDALLRYAMCQNVAILFVADEQTGVECVEGVLASFDAHSLVLMRSPSPSENARAERFNRSDVDAFALVQCLPSEQAVEPLASLAAC
jgi:hypothetical protein